MDNSFFLFVLVGLGFGFIGYLIGRASMLADVVKAVAEETINELNQKEELKNGKNILTVEKHNNVYYAYIDKNFAAQGSTFVELFTAIKANKKYDFVNINKETSSQLNLDPQDAKLMSEAIIEVYGKNQ